MFKEIIIENQEFIKNIDLIERNIKFDIDVLALNKIISFIGPRRAGKTFYMFQVAKDLVRNKIIDFTQIVFIDFSEYYKTDFDFDKLLEEYYTIFPDKEPFFIFDEVQEVNNFRQGILKLFNKGFKIFMSGSNSKMLSSELSTHFSGRNLEYQIYPLSFLEYIKFQGFNIYENMTVKQIGMLKNIFDSYLKYGSYPEIALAKNENLKNSIMQNYLDIIIFKDLKQRYSISNEYVLKYLIKKVVLSNTKDLNISKIFNELKSQNVEVSKNTLYNYLEYLINIFYLKKLHNYFTPNGNIKIFLIDWGFGNIYRENDLGKKLENIVFMELIRNYGKIYFERGKMEIDFFIESKNKHIQVVYELNLENYKRELGSFEGVFGEKILLYFENNLDKNILEKYKDVKFTQIIDYLIG